ncbi:MAG: 50S ribosomal protein L30 [Nitrospinota bacterium]|nr:MAG: 50S ribosomal protein L30 [Nitrospinota bacterium]
MAGRLRITLVHSGIGRPHKQKLILRGLGLTRLHKTVIRPDRPDIWGMIHRVRHLVKVEREEEEGVA